MNEMKTVAEVVDGLGAARPGDKVLVKDYEDSHGEVRDLEVELLGPDDYGEMQEEDLATLQDADLDALDLGDVLPADAEAARQGLVGSRRSSIERRKGGQAGAGYRGPAYETIQGSLAKHPDGRAGVYLQRVRVLSAPPEPKPAKGAVPRAKQVLGKVLDLPTRRYAQNIHLCDGKFTSVTLA